MDYIIATEKDAIDISGSTATITNGLCCTKTRATALGCLIKGAYADNLLVCKKDLYIATLGTPIIEKLTGTNAALDSSWTTVGTGYSYYVPASGGTYRIKTIVSAESLDGTETVTLYDTTNGSISVSNLGTTYNASSGAVLGTRTCSGTVLGTTMTGSPVTFYKSANTITLSFITLPTWSDIPASGGSSTLSNTPKVRLTFSSGSTIDLSYNTTTYGTWTVGSVSADNLTTTPKSRTKIGTLTVKYTLSSSYGGSSITSNSVDVYLAANAKYTSSTSTGSTSRTNTKYLISGTTSCPDIPARGGTVHATFLVLKATGTESGTYTIYYYKWNSGSDGGSSTSATTWSGTTSWGSWANYTTVDGSDVSAPSLAAGEKSRTKVGTSSYSDSTYGSGSAYIYQAANVKTFTSVICTVSGSSNIPTTYMNQVDWVGASGGTLTLNAYALYSYTTGNTSNTDVSSSATYAISTNVSINGVANAVTISGRTITVPTRGTVTGENLYPKFKATWNSKTSDERACGILYNHVESETDTSNSNYTGTVSIGSGLGAGATSATVTASAFHSHAYKNLYTSGSKDSSYKYSYPTDTCYISLSSSSTSTKTSGRWTLSSNSSGATLSHSTMGTTLGTDSITVYVYNGGTKVGSKSTSVTNSVTKVVPYATSTSHVMYNSSYPVSASGTTSAVPYSYNGSATYTFSSGSTTNDASSSPSFGGSASYSRTYSNYDSVFSVNSSGRVTATSRGTNYSTSQRLGNITAKLVVTYTHPSGYTGGTVTSSTLTLYPTVYLDVNPIDSLLLSGGIIDYNEFDGNTTYQINDPIVSQYPTATAVFRSGSSASASLYGTVSHSFSYSTSGNSTKWSLNSSTGRLTVLSSNYSETPASCYVYTRDTVNLLISSTYGGGSISDYKTMSTKIIQRPYGYVIISGTNLYSVGTKVCITLAYTSGSNTVDFYGIPNSYVYTLTAEDVALGYKVVLVQGASLSIIAKKTEGGSYNMGTTLTSSATVRAAVIGESNGNYTLLTGSGGMVWTPNNEILLILGSI